jgi:hypothetical protein
MVDLILTTFDWVPETPRCYVHAYVCVWHWKRPGRPIASRACYFPLGMPRILAPTLRPIAVVDRWRHLDLESGAILLHLGERSDALMPADPRSRWRFCRFCEIRAAAAPVRQTRLPLRDDCLRPGFGRTIIRNYEAQFVPRRASLDVAPEKLLAAWQRKRFAFVRSLLGGCL